MDHFDEAARKAHRRINGFGTETTMDQIKAVLAAISWDYELVPRTDPLTERMSDQGE